MRQEMRARPKARGLRTALLLLLVASPCAAHHILGLPHYKYDANYPQIPYVEVLAQVGELDAVFSYFPGNPRPGQRVRLKLYVVNRTSGAPLSGALTADIVEKRFMRDPRVLRQPFAIEQGQGPEAHDYKFFHSFAEAEQYAVRVAIPREGGFEVVAFPVTVGATDSRPLILGAVGLLTLCVGVVAVLKRRRSGAQTPAGLETGRSRA